MAGLQSRTSVFEFLILAIVAGIANGALYIEFQVDTVGNCSTAELQFSARFSGDMAITTTNIDLMETNYLNTLVRNKEVVRMDEPGVFTWQSNPVTEGTSCCWQVSMSRFTNEDRTDSVPIEICNSGNVERHICDNANWTCTQSQILPTDNNLANPVTQVVSRSYMFSSEVIKLNECIATAQNETMYDSTPPDDFCISATVTPSPSSTFTPISSTTPIEPTPSSEVYCVSDGRWTSTPTNTNITLQGACFDGAVDGTRRCDEEGEWNDPYCIVSQTFYDIRNEILQDPNDGLEALLIEVNGADSSELTIEQFQFLFELVVDTYQDRQIIVSSVERIEQFLGVTEGIAELIINRQNSNLSINDKKQRRQGAQLLLVPDEYGLTVAQPSNDITYNFQSISFRVHEFDNSYDNPLEETMVIQVGRNFISIPLSSIEATEAVRVASFHFQNLSQLLPPSDPNSTIVSSIISATTNCSSCPIDDLDKNVTIQLQLEMLPLHNQTLSCVHFQFVYDDDNNQVVGGDWIMSGCTTTVNGDLVTCSCNHLTHFAILLSPGGPEISPIHHDVLNTIGLVLVPISLLCMVLVILTYTLIRSLWSMRNYIHIMLCASLFMAQLVFIIGVDKIENQDACSAVAVILLYLFLVTFMWMLMEGVVLYITLVKVFITNHKYYIIAFTVASYGVPALYLAVVTPIGFLINTDGIPDHTHFLYYRKEESEQLLTACWLNYSTGFIWSFIAPVIIIIMINIGFFIMAIVIAKRHSNEQTKVAEALHWLQVTISLTVVMGIAWLMGLLAFRRELLPVVYITTIFIAAQGIILFIILVPLSKQVRKVFAAKFLKKDRSAQSVGLSRLASRQTRTFSLQNTNSVSSIHKYKNSIGGQVIGPGNGRRALQSMGESLDIAAAHEPTAVEVPPCT